MKSLRGRTGRPLREVADLVDEFMAGESGPVILHYKSGELVMIEPPLRIKLEDLPSEATSLIGPVRSAAS